MCALYVTAFCNSCTMKIQKVNHTYEIEKEGKKTDNMQFFFIELIKMISAFTLKTLCSSELGDKGGELDKNRN